MKCLCQRQANGFIPRLRVLPVRAAAALVALLTMVAPARAVDYYWDLNGTTAGASGDGVTPSTTASGTWNATNTYWNTDSTGGAGDTISAWQSGGVAVFSAGGNATGTYTVAVNGTHQIGGLRFEEGAVTLSSLGVLQFSGGATFTHNGTAGDCQINSLVQGNGTLTLAGAGNWGRVNGVISESGGTLSVNLASGNWVFGGQHTYTGGTTITGYAVTTVGSTGSASSGDLTSGPFGTGTLILQSGTLRPTSGGPITIGNAVTLDGNFTFGTSDTSHNLTFTGPLTLTGTRTLTTTNSNVYFNGALGDGGGNYGFTKSGTSSLILGGDASNTFTDTVTVSSGALILQKSAGTTAIAGNIVINGGRLSLGAANQIADTSNVTLNSGVWFTEHEETIQSLAINSAPTVAGYSYHLINHLNVTGTLSIAAGETVVGSGTSSQAGSVSMTGGVLAVAANTGNSTLSIGIGGLSMSGATLRVGSDGGTHTALVNLSGDFTGSGTNVISAPNNTGPRLLNLQGAARTFNITNGVTTIAPTIQNGGLVKTGTGTLTLAGNNTFTGGVTIGGGTLSLANAGSLNSAAPNAVSFASNADSKILQLASNGVTVSGLTTGTTVGTSVVENGTVGTATLTVNNAAANTFAGVLQNGAAGTLALTKTGAGTLTLSGSTANTYTGLTTVSAGTVHLFKSSGNAVGGNLTISNGARVSFGASHQIADSAAVAMSGSGSVFNGTGVNSGQFNITETIDSLTVTGGTFNTASGGNWTITGMASFTGGTGNTIVVGNSGTTLRFGGLSLTDMTATAGSTVETNNSFTLYGNTTQRSSITVGASGLTLSNSRLNLRRGGTNALGSRLVLDGNVTTTGTAASWIMEDTAGGTNGTVALELSSTAGDVTRTFNIGGGGANLTISVPVTNGAATLAGIAKTGDGTLTLSGSAANTYNGLTTVSAGTLSLNKTEHVNAIAGDIVVNGGTLILAANHQIADTSNITVNGSANFNSNERTETVNNLTLNSSYTDAGNHRISNVTVNGTLDITKGVVGINSGASATANTLSMSGGSRIDMAASTNPTTLNIGGGGLTMSGATLRLGWDGLGSAHAARVNLGGDFIGSGTNSITYLTLDADRLLDLQNATRTFNITGGVTTIAPTIQNGGLTKTGDGTLTLTGANTYAGPTSVDAGLLLVHGAHTGGGAYSVQNSGTLGGTGTVGAAVGIGSGGTLAPGASIGTLAIGGDLTLGVGSTFAWEFNSNLLTADLLNLDGNLNLALAGGASLNLIDLASSAAEMELGTKFTLISYSGNWNGGLFDDHANYSQFESGANQWRIRYDDIAGGLNLGEFGSYVTLTVVPEPSSILLLLGAGLGWLAARRRRR